MTRIIYSCVIIIPDFMAFHIWRNKGCSIILYTTILWVKFYFHCIKTSRNRCWFRLLECNAAAKSTNRYGWHWRVSTMHNMYVSECMCTPWLPRWRTRTTSSIPQQYTAKNIRHERPRIEHSNSLLRCRNLHGREQHNQTSTTWMTRFHCAILLRSNNL